MNGTLIWSSQSLPARLPLPVALFFGMVLIASGTYFCFHAFDVAETGSAARFVLMILAGWLLADSGCALILFRLGIW